MSDFSEWMRARGFHGKQISEAGRAIGHGNATTSQKTYHGERELTDTERLAMSAVAAGLAPWTPETERETAAVRAFLDLVRDRSATSPNEP